MGQKQEKANRRKIRKEVHGLFGEWESKLRTKPWYIPAWAWRRLQRLVINIDA